MSKRVLSNKKANVFALWQAVTKARYFLSIKKVLDTFEVLSWVGSTKRKKFSAEISSNMEKCTIGQIWG
jgi:hypothetical protein